MENQQTDNCFTGVRPIRRHALLLDDQESYTENGVLVRKELGCDHMDFYVVRVGTEEDVDFGQGDRVIVSHQDVGRRVKIDGTIFRVVKVCDILAVIGG